MTWITEYTSYLSARTSRSIPHTKTHIHIATDTHTYTVYGCLCECLADCWDGRKVTNSLWVEQISSTKCLIGCKLLWLLLSLFRGSWYVNDRTHSGSVMKWKVRGKTYPGFINLGFHINYVCRALGLQCDLSRSIGVYQIRHVLEDIYKYP